MKRTTLTVMLSLLGQSAIAQGIWDYIDKQCYDAEIERFLDRKTLNIFSDQGCTAPQATLELGGVKNNECRARLCWPAPPSYRILEASYQPHSQNKQTSHSGPHYVPNRDAATQVCFDVFARTSGGAYSGRAWMNINAQATVEKFSATKAEHEAAMGRCLKSN